MCRKRLTIVIVNCWRVLKQSGSLRSQRMGFWQVTEVFSDYLSLLKSAKNQVTDDVERFLVKGRVHTWPSRAQDKNALLRWILQKSIPASEQFSEREVNERIRRYTDDPALVRRYGVDHGILERDPATQIYRRIR